MPDDLPHDPADAAELFARAMETLPPVRESDTAVPAVPPTGETPVPLLPEGVAWVPPSVEALGAMLPQFRIDALLGQGGMGAVYKAFQPNLRRFVALKLLSEDYSSDAAFVAKFHQEARILAKLNHPRISSIYDLGETSEGHLYFSMEFIEGENLRTILAGGPLSQEKALLYTSQICDALGAAHLKKIVHRDIKPENVIIDEDGNVKLVDFGLATPVRDAGAGPSGTILMGTPDYTAPEVLADDADHRSDLFALGVMLYEMLTGAVPSGTYQPASRRANCDARIDRVIARAVQPSRETRYQSAADFQTLVDHIRTTKSDALVVAQPRALGMPRTITARLVAAAGGKKRFPFVALAVVLALGAAGYFAWDRSTGVPPTVSATSGETPDGPTGGTPVLRRDGATARSTAVPAVGPAGVPPAATSGGTPVPQFDGRKTIERIEGEKMKVVKVTGGEAKADANATKVTAVVWSGGTQLIWRNAAKNDVMVLKIPVSESGLQRVKAVLLASFDCGVAEVSLDGKLVAGSPFDQQAEEPTVSGILDFGLFDLAQGEHELKIKMVNSYGTNRVGGGTHVFGIDYLQLEPPTRTVPPAAPGTDVARNARPSASFCPAHDTVQALNNGKAPPVGKNHHSQKYPRLSWWPRYDGLEWAQYEWETPQAINECQIYWFDAGVRELPMFYRILYREESGAWVPVEATIPNAEADKWNVVKFPAVKTTALRISLQCQRGKPAGIYGWKALAADPATVGDPKQRARPDLFLGDLSPLHSQLGFYNYRVNTYTEHAYSHGMKVLADGKPCTQFMWAHTSSRLEFAIPQGYTRLKALGVRPTSQTSENRALGTWKYVIEFDGKVAFESRELRSYPDMTVPIDLSIPPDAKRLTLITDKMGDSEFDHAFWAYPTLLAGEDPSKLAAAPIIAPTPAPTPVPTPTIPIVTEPGFTSLLDSAHAGKWKHAGWLPISLKDGLVDTVTPNRTWWGMLWYTEKKFGDFTLKLEFKRSSDAANSGVFVRFDDPKGDPYRPGKTGYEIELAGDHGVGSIVDHTKAGSPPEKIGEWNTMEITVVASHMNVKVNDTVVTDYDVGAAPTGYIALQNCVPGTQFRNVRIKELPPQTIPTIVPKTVEEALLGFEWKWNTTGKNEAELSAYFTPGGKMKRVNKDKLWQWAQTGPLEFTLKGPDAKSTTMRFADNTFQKMEGPDFDGTYRHTGQRGSAIMPPAKILAGLKTAIAPPPTPAVVPAPPAGTSIETTIANSRWDTTNEKNQRAWGDVTFRASDFSTMNGIAGQWKATGPRTVELGTTYLLQFAEDMNSFTATMKDGTKVATGTRKVAAAAQPAPVTPSAAPTPAAAPTAKLLLPGVPNLGGLRSFAPPTVSDIGAGFKLTYETGFEPPIFTPGAFHIGRVQTVCRTDLRWSLFNDGKSPIADFIAGVSAGGKSGTQSLKVDAKAASKNHSGFSAVVENAGGSILVSADVVFVPSARPTRWQFALGDTEVPGGYVAGFNVLADGSGIELTTGRGTFINEPIKRKEWMRIQVRVDTRKQSFDVFIDGKGVALNAPMLVAAKRIRTFQFATAGDGDDAAYLDNFSFAVRPDEPDPATLPAEMRGRVSTGRAEAMRVNKMLYSTEQAVLRGLEWLRLNQNPDGSWGNRNTGAMTGFALLCFLGHGETDTSVKYGEAVKKGISWMLENGTKYQARLSMTDAFGQPGVYEHGIATYALAEYYAMTKDVRVVELLKRAVTYIVQGRGNDGGWMYGYDKTQSDTSVSGWQIQALKAAHLTGLNIPGVDEALDKAMGNLDRVKGANGGYGYRDANEKYSLTGVGILCSLIWRGDKGELRRGMDWMLDTTENQSGVRYKSEHADLYAWYYHTNACFQFGGVAWQKWNRWFQDDIVAVQSPDGSWPITGGKGIRQNDTDKTGQVYRTALCTLMLETFYRYDPRRLR